MEEEERGLFFSHGLESVDDFFFFFFKESLGKSQPEEQAQARRNYMHALITFLHFSSVCRFVMNEMSNTCTFCGDISSDSKSTFVSFDILVDLTDHTGTLYSCYLSDCVAEETLGCTVSTSK